MGTQRRSRRLLGLTPEVPEFYSCNDREKLAYIQSNLHRVLRLRAILDAALAAAHVNLPGRVRNVVGHDGSSRTTLNSGHLNHNCAYVALHDRQRLDEDIEAGSSPSSSAYNDTAVAAVNSDLNSGGPIRRPGGRKRVQNTSSPASKLGKPHRSRAKRQSVIRMVDKD